MTIEDVIDVDVVATSPVIRGGLTHVLATVPRVRLRRVVDSLTALPRDERPGQVVIVDLYGHPASRVNGAFWALLPAGSHAVALCRPEDPPALLAALHGGVRALVTRECAAEQLTQAVRTAHQGGLHVSPDLVTPLLARTTNATERDQTLAGREIETLRLVAEGLTHGQIGRRLGLTEATVSTYVKRIRNKLNAGNKAELTRRAIDLGYLDPLRRSQP